MILFELLLKITIMQKYYCREKNGKIKKGGYKGGMGYCGYHISFDNQKVYLRSLLEYNYALYLDKTKQYYKVEAISFEINKKRFKPDFFIYNNDYTKLLKIVDIKSSKKESKKLLICKNYFNKINIEYEIFFDFKSIKKFITNDEKNGLINM